MAKPRPSRADQVIRWISTFSVIVLAGIAAVISYKHMYELVLRYGETSWTAALLPVSVDGMIVVASMSLLVDSRHCRRSGLLPWTLLVLGSAASLAANVAVAEPSVVGRLIAAWPSCALIGTYELLMRQVRNASTRKADPACPVSYVPPESPHRISGLPQVTAEDSLTSPHLITALSDESLRSMNGSLKRTKDSRSNPAMEVQISPELPKRPDVPNEPNSLLGRQSSQDDGGLKRADLQRRAWRWAVSQRTPEGDLPPGKVIGGRFGRSERWGRLVKAAGRAGHIDAIP